MRSIIVIVLLIIVPAILKANNFSDIPIKYWHSGEAFLNNGEKVKGKIYYEIDKELLLVFAKGQIKTYSPNQIDRFSMIDKEFGQERMFYSLPISVEGIARRNYFFEIMTEGHIVYLRKQRTRSDGFGLFVFDESHLNNYSAFFDYYFLINENLIRIKKFKKDALTLMAEHKERLIVFIEKNGLQLNKIKDQVMLLKYYNALCAEGNITANQTR